MTDCMIHGTKMLTGRDIPGGCPLTCKGREIPGRPSEIRSHTPITDTLKTMTTEEAIAFGDGYNKGFAKCREELTKPVSVSLKDTVAKIADNYGGISDYLSNETIVQDVLDAAGVKYAD
jgi:hypothetical protein